MAEPMSAECKAMVSRSALESAMERTCLVCHRRAAVIISPMRPSRPMAHCRYCDADATVEQHNMISVRKRASKHGRKTLRKVMP